MACLVVIPLLLALIIPVANASNWESAIVDHASLLQRQVAASVAIPGQENTFKLGLDNRSCDGHAKITDLRTCQEALKSLGLIVLVSPPRGSRRGCIGRMEERTGYFKLDGGEDGAGSLICKTSAKVVLPRATSLCNRKKLVPSVFVAGTQKAGTTFLWSAMEHTSSSLTSGTADEVWTEKEKFYFSRTGTYDLGLDWYLSFYPSCPTIASTEDTEMIAVPDSRLIGMDNTANLLDQAEAPLRIWNTYRTAVKYLKFIILLREPMHLLVSKVYMELGKKVTRPSQSMFEDKVLSELQAGHTPPCLESFLSGDFWKNQSEACGVICIGKTMQASFLEYWLEYFQPSQFILISSDLLFSETDAVLRHLYSLLDLPAPMNITGNAKLIENRGGPETIPDRDTELYRSLYALYSPQVQRLSTLLQKHSRGFYRIGKLEWLSNYSAQE